jgi:hypothetical protein
MKRRPWCLDGRELEGLRVGGLRLKFGGWGGSGRVE